MLIFNMMVIHYRRMHRVNVLHNFFGTFMNNIILYRMNNFLHWLLTLAWSLMLLPKWYLPTHHLSLPFPVISLLTYATYFHLFKTSTHSYVNIIQVDVNRSLQK